MTIGGIRKGKAILMLWDSLRLSSKPKEKSKKEEEEHIM